jgi:tRNA nucleotidyltransferase/poly(A) polymerase
VALVRGKVVAQGATREEAFQAARSARRKDRLELRYMPEMPVKSPLLDAVRALLPADLPVYLVGGAVRDAVLGRPVHDLDFATPPGALKLAKKLADKLSGAFFPLDDETDTARIVVQRPDGTRDFLDFAGYRGDSLEADLLGRDFTINAISIDVHSGQVIDPLGGLHDLREKRIRACTETSFTDDPVRILRAIRQAAAFDFSIQPETRKLMRAAVSLLPKASPERQRDELFKMLEGPKPDASVRALELLGVLPVLLPELPALKGVEQSAPHVHDVWAHTLAVLRHLDGVLAVLAPEYNEEKGNADLLNGLLALRLGRYRKQVGEHLGSRLNADRSARALLFFAALYHDVSKPQTRLAEASGRIRFFGHDEKGALTAVKRGMALHLSNDELDRLKLIITYHMRIHPHTDRKAGEGKDPTRRAIYRFFRDTGEAGVDLVLLALADMRATYDHTLTQERWTACLDVCRILLEAYYEKTEEIVRPPQILTGNDLIKEFNMKPGPEIGKLLEAIRETQAAGKLSTREEALAFSRGWLLKSKTS